MLSVVLISLIDLYKVALSPLLPPSCRYIPTCSDYTKSAISKYGAIKGGWRGFRRILRCHPFHSGGYDPVD